MSNSSNSLIADGATSADITTLREEERDQLTEINVRIRTLQHALEANDVAAPIDEPLR